MKTWQFIVIVFLILARTTTKLPDGRYDVMEFIFSLALWGVWILSVYFLHRDKETK